MDNSIFQFLGVPLIVFIGTVAFIPMVCKLARYAQFVDIPDERKKHESPVPPLGGISIFIVFMLATSLLGGLPWAVLVALALMLVVGVIDDARGMNATLKFVLHFISAFILVVGGQAQLHSLGNLLGFGEMEMGWATIPFSVACVVYIQNAINMMDGVDGLAGGNSFIIFSWLLLAAVLGGNTGAGVQISILLACLAGFLVYNMRSPIRSRAIIFLGDAGSMALGLMIAWYSMTLSQGPDSVIRPVSVAWLIALPIVDSFGLLAARLKDRKPPFAPDRRHFHHHFQHAGFTPSQTTRLILLWSATLGAIGFFGVRANLPEGLFGWLWIALWMGHTVVTIKSEKFIQLLQVLRAKIQRQSSP